MTTVTLDGRSRVVRRSGTCIAFVVDYGAELVSANGVPAIFTFSNFSVDAR